MYLIFEKLISILLIETVYQIQTIVWIINLIGLETHTLTVFEA